MYDTDMQVIHEIGNITGVRYSKEQLDILQHRGGMCILACAGSGKTTSLTHLIVKRIKTGEITDVNKLLCTTYSKAGSLEMEDKLNILFRKLGMNTKVQVKTLHASYYMILKHFGLTRNVCSNSQRLSFITASCREAGVMLKDEDLQLIDSLLSFQVNNLLSDDALVKSYVYTLEDVPIDKYAMIRTGYNRRKEEAGIIDFDDMQLYIYCLLVKEKRPDVLAFCRSMWEYFYIDEFQDVSKIQFAILREMVTDPNKLVVIGDDDQCIYQWRGADPNIILNICGYYDISKFLLSTNYRCQGNIVNHAAVGIKNNEKRAEKTMTPYCDGGEIKICDIGSGNLYDMSKVAFKHIENTIESGKFGVKDIAILSRNNLHLSILNNMLFEKGIYTTTAPDMRMTNTNMYKDLKNVMEMASNTYNSGVVHSTLWRCCSYLGVKGSKLVADFMASTGCNLRDSLGYILTTYARRGRDVDWKGNIRVPQKANDKMEYIYSSVKMESEDMLVGIYNILCKKKEEEKIAELFAYYLQATDFMYKSNDRVRNIYGLVAYISDMINRKGLQQARDFLRMSEQYESGNMEIPGDKITMSTMHGAKGREWRHVILFADDNVTFPSFEGIGKMLFDRIDLKDISGGIDEDRRLHYVAMTRAKNNLTLFADKKNLSVYTLEALGLLSKGEGKFNQHIIAIANNGCLPQDLLNTLEINVFDKSSPYFYEIDMDNQKE